MNKCTNCGSHAINPHMHGRGGDNLDLCDVCYWRARFDALRDAVAKMLTAYKNAEECSCPYCMKDFESAHAEVDRLLEEEKV